MPYAARGPLGDGGRGGLGRRLPPALGRGVPKTASPGWADGMMPVHMGTGECERCMEASGVKRAAALSLTQRGCGGNR
jgi:hypothetical protein